MKRRQRKATDLKGRLEVTRGALLGSARTESTASTSGALALVAIALWTLTSHARLLLEGRRDNVRGQVEVLAQVLDTLVRQEIIEMIPGELLANEFTRLEREHELEDIKIGHVDLVVLGLRLNVLLSDEDTLCNENENLKGLRAKKFKCAEACP